MFGILKRRFPILARTPEYPFETQVNLVQALAGLHNFIRQKSPDTEIQDWDETDEERAKRYENDDFLLEGLGQDNSVPSDDHRMGQFRDQIAQDLWDSYIQVRVQRNQMNLAV